MRNKSITCKKSLSILLSLLLGGNVLLCNAQQEEADLGLEPSTTETEAAAETSTQSETTEPGDKQPESEPASRFTPTEKIGAADTISLPVDI
jgi:hypothetical protein